nr:MAG TPA: hypothetical protein [Caudoviricetes sp.]
MQKEFTNQENEKYQPVTLQPQGFFIYFLLVIFICSK